MSQSNERAREVPFRGRGRGGVMAFARSQLRAVVGEAVQGSLHILAQPRTPARQLDPSAVGERLRDAVYRDRGLRAAQAQRSPSPAVLGPVDGPSAGEPSAAPAGSAPADEPIRTRTMARLLAQQGAYERALRIYDLVLQESPDPGLQREVDSLRATLASR